MALKKNKIYFSCLELLKTVKSLKCILRFNLNHVKWNSCAKNRKYIVLFSSQKASVCRFSLGHFNIYTPYRLHWCENHALYLLALKMSGGGGGGEECTSQVYFDSLIDGYSHFHLPIIVTLTTSVHIKRMQLLSNSTLKEVLYLPIYDIPFLTGFFFFKAKL